MKYLIIGLTLLAFPAAAQEGVVYPCGDAERLDSLAEPWEDNTATYAGGSVRVARVDMVEPAAAAWKLAIISPPRDELGIRQCRIVQSKNGMGFYDLDFAARRSSYDPERGLTLTMPAQTYDTEDPNEGRFTLTVTVNQQTGDITVEGEP